MQGPGDPDEDRSAGFEHVGWQMPYFDDDFAKVAFEGMAEDDAYLFGRGTYEIKAAYWPFQPDDVPFAASLNGLPEYVASTTLSEPLEWAELHPAPGRRGQRRGRAQGAAREDLVVLGSGKLVQILMENDLVDEYGCRSTRSSCGAAVPGG